MGGPAGRRPCAGRLKAELRRLGRVPLVVIDEVACIPFQGKPANLFFQLVSSMYYSCNEALDRG